MMLALSCDFTFTQQQMTADEKAIVQFLKGWGSTFVSAREIARKVGGKRRFTEDRGWALPILIQMLRANILETDHFGYYRLKPDGRKNRRAETYVAPQILKILKSAGKNFDSIVIDDDLEDVPELKYRLPSPPTPAGSK